LHFDVCRKYIFQADHLLLHTRTSLRGRVDPKCVYCDLKYLIEKVRAHFV
jgi:hypothetical protein